MKMLSCRLKKNSIYNLINEIIGVNFIQKYISQLTHLNCRRILCPIRINVSRKILPNIKK